MKRLVALLSAAILLLGIGGVIASPAAANVGNTGCSIAGIGYSITNEYYYYTDGSGLTRVRYVRTIVNPSQTVDYAVRMRLTSNNGTHWDSGYQPAFGRYERWAPSQANARIVYTPVIRVSIRRNGAYCHTAYTVNGN